jgi:hypothetical protein
MRSASARLSAPNCCKRAGPQASGRSVRADTQSTRWRSGRTAARAAAAGLLHTIHRARAEAGQSAPAAGERIVPAGDAAWPWWGWQNPPGGRGGQPCRHFAHGVVFVPLAPVSHPAEIVPTIAEALGLALTGNSELISQLLTYLRDQSLLLVLDNLGTCLTVKAAPPIWCSGCWCRHANRQHMCGVRRHFAMLGGAPDAADATADMLADLAHAPRGPGLMQSRRS